jgi:hypothetical protein
MRHHPVERWMPEAKLLWSMEGAGETQPGMAGGDAPAGVLGANRSPPLWPGWSWP